MKILHNPDSSVDCLKMKKNPIPLEEVEPVEKIMKRFVTGAMSLWFNKQGSSRDDGYCNEQDRRTKQYR